jgi:hypothetical protein
LIKLKTTLVLLPMGIIQCSLASEHCAQSKNHALGEVGVSADKSAADGTVSACSPIRALQGWFFFALTCLGSLKTNYPIL